MKLIGIMVLLSLVTPASADVTLERYEQMKNLELFKAHIEGVGTGMLWSNVAMKAKTGQGLFCPPPNFALTGATYLQILSEQAVKVKSKLPADTPLAPILLDGLIETFPCEQKEGLQ
jgi:hypothetical protein